MTTLEVMKTELECVLRGVVLTLAWIDDVNDRIKKLENDVKELKESRE